MSNFSIFLEGVVIDEEVSVIVGDSVGGGVGEVAGVRIGAGTSSLLCHTSPSGTYELPSPAITHILLS